MDVTATRDSPGFGFYLKLEGEGVCQMQGVLMFESLSVQVILEDQIEW
jgi:hypothetical protein